MFSHPQQHIIRHGDQAGYNKKTWFRDTPFSLSFTDAWNTTCTLVISASFPIIAWCGRSWILFAVLYSLPIFTTILFFSYEWSHHIPWGHQIHSSVFYADFLASSSLGCSCLAKMGVLFPWQSNSISFASKFDVVQKIFMCLILFSYPNNVIIPQVHHLSFQLQILFGFIDDQICWHYFILLTMHWSW